MKSSSNTSCQFRRGLLAVLAGGLLAWQPAAQACTRFLWNDNPLAVIVGRSMDWPESTQPALTVLPRGIKRDGGRAGAAVVVKENPARWTAKYGSIVTTIYGIGTADGLNERGLGTHMLYLQATDFGPRDAAKPGLQAALWAQYLLDQFQVVMVETHGHRANVRLAIEDAGGDSAVIEFVNGKQVVHHGREYRIMTNDPPYDQQIALLKTHDFSKPSSDTPIPGNVKATDHFVRTAYFGAMLTPPKTKREAVASMLAVVRNVSVPFGAPYGGLAHLHASPR